MASKNRIKIAANGCWKTHLNALHLEPRDVPAPLTWSTGPSLTNPRGGVVGVEYNGYTSLVLGGTTTEVTGFAAANPTWKTNIVNEAAMDVSRNFAGAGQLSGMVLVFGGKSGNNSGTIGTTLYDITGNNTDNGADMHTGRYAMGYATDANLQVYAIGGKSNNTTTLSSVERYNQTANAWTLLAPLPVPLSGLAAVYDNNGHVFAFGGVTSNGVLSATVYRYTVASNTWDTVAALPLATKNALAVLGSNGRIYLLGGITGAGTTANIESYDISANAWTDEAPLPAPLSSEAAMTDSLGRIIVAGGFDSTGAALGTVYISQQLNQPDSAAVFTSSPGKAVVYHTAYSYQALTTANPQATYDLVAAPAGMTIDGITGLVSWLSADVEGNNTITVRASNSAGQTTQTYTLAVQPAAPTGVTATGLSTSSIQVSWDPSSDPNVISHSVYTKTWHPNAKGSGGTWIYGLVAGDVTANNVTISGLPSGKSYNYVVTAFGAGVTSAYSAAASGTTWIAPTLSTTFLIPPGAVWSSPAPAVYGQSNQLTLISYGTPAPTYSIVSGPTGLTIDPVTGVVTYVPANNDHGIVNFTAQVSNPVGTATQSYSFLVKWAPTITLTGGTYIMDGYPHPAILSVTGITGAPVAGSSTIMYSYTGTPPIIYTGTFTATANFTSSDPEYANGSATTTITLVNSAPPQIGSVVINAGQAQRSRVTTLSILFDQHVTLPTNPPNAFQLIRHSDGAPVALAGVADDSGQRTIVNLTFTGGAVNLDSLQDGRYDLTALTGSISSLGGQLDGNGDGTGGDSYYLNGDPATNGLFRLFGDADGNGAVTASDFNAFRLAYGTGPSIFDFDNDGQTTAADFNNFRTRYGVTI